jgi:hypothetical protein
MPTNTSPANGPADRPYPRSWVDALVDAIDGLPGPAWIAYALITAVFVAAGTGVQWLDGALPLGTFDLPLIVIDLLSVYGLAAIHYAKRAARRSLDAFRPALGELESEEPTLRYRLTQLPRRWGVVSTVVGVLIAALSLATGAEAWYITAKTSPVGIAFIVVQAVMMMVFFLVFWFFAYHQLLTVARIHRTATNVRLLETSARSGFSSLTLSSSITVALPIYVSALSYAAIGQFAVGISAVDIALMVVILTTAALVFVVPLYGMHRRLAQQKGLAVDAVGRSLDVTTTELRARVAARDFDGIAGISSALSSLVAERDIVRRATTWPWEAETLRGFVSSIVLPLAIWLTTTLLGRLLASFA